MPRPAQLATFYSKSSQESDKQMKMSGVQLLSERREAVWSALNDVDVLSRCIPGCESLTRAEDDVLDAVATIKVGPVKARFRGRVALSDIVPPESYVISGQGQGGAAGFAKGSARPPG